MEGLSSNVVESEFLRYFKDHYNEIVEYIESNKERMRHDTKSDKKLTRLYGNAHGRYCLFCRYGSRNVT
jgi:hypothetical protein